MKDILMKERTINYIKIMGIILLTAIVSLGISSVYNSFTAEAEMPTEEEEDITYIEFSDPDDILDEVKKTKILDEVMLALPIIFEYEEFRINETYNAENYYIVITVSPESYGRFVGKHYYGTTGDDVTQDVIYNLEDSVKETEVILESHFDKPITGILFDTPEMGGNAFISYHPESDTMQLIKD